MSRTKSRSRAKSRHAALQIVRVQESSLVHVHSTAAMVPKLVARIMRLEGTWKILCKLCGPDLLLWELIARASSLARFFVMVCVPALCHACAKILLTDVNSCP
jgi:hypothetical protein